MVLKGLFYESLCDSVSLWLNGYKRTRSPFCKDSARSFIASSFSCWVSDSFLGMRREFWSRYRLSISTFNQPRGRSFSVSLRLLINSGRAVFRLRVMELNPAPQPSLKRKDLLPVEDKKSE